MAQTFRSSEGADARLDPLDEDVNPSAHLVNLADCMLVLACGFLVALMVAGSGIASQQEAFSESDLQELDAETAQLPEDAAGSGYQDVGDVYYDPATGNYYLYERDRS